MTPSSDSVIYQRGLQNSETFYLLSHQFITKECNSGTASGEMHRTRCGKGQGPPSLLSEPTILPASPGVHQPIHPWGGWRGWNFNPVTTQLVFLAFQNHLLHISSGVPGKGLLGITRCLFMALVTENSKAFRSSVPGKRAKGKYASVQTTIAQIKMSYFASFFFYSTVHIFKFYSTITFTFNIVSYQFQVSSIAVRQSCTF